MPFAEYEAALMLSMILRAKPKLNPDTIPRSPAQSVVKFFTSLFQHKTHEKRFNDQHFS